MSRQTEEYGVVEQVRQPLIAVKGLPGAHLGELVKISSGAHGQVFSLSPEKVEIYVFAGAVPLVGDTVTRTGQPLKIDLSNRTAGCTVHPLCQLSTAAAATATDTAPIPLTGRQHITQPLTTGVSIVDLVLALGKGQRELIVGDRKSGKTSFALQVAEHQAKRGSAIVYAAIGKLSSEIKRIQRLIHQKGFADSVTLVASAADDPPTVIYQTPFTAMTIAEQIALSGQDVVLILDDLTTHAKSYREIALVGKRFPGRDSYPGDIFFTHARLLERAGCFRNDKQPQTGSALSCLPLAETVDSELTDYIVSNLISITDGHLLFDSRMFAAGHRPAINSGLSVTRVGRQTQSPLQLAVANALTQQLHHFQKIKNLTHFGAELTAETTTILQRGEALQAFFNQTKEVVFSGNTMLIMSTAILNDWLNTVAAKDIQARHAALEAVYLKKPAIRAKIDELVTVAKTLKELQKLVLTEKSWLESVWQQ